MRIFLLGGTGKTGMLFKDMALENGHQVTVFIRSPEKVMASENLTIIKGDLSSVTQMSEAMKDHDVHLGVAKIFQDRTWLIFY